MVRCPSPLLWVIVIPSKQQCAGKTLWRGLAEWKDGTTTMTTSTSTRRNEWRMEVADLAGLRYCMVLYGSARSDPLCGTDLIHFAVKIMSNFWRDKIFCPVAVTSWLLPVLLLGEASTGEKMSIGDPYPRFRASRGGGFNHKNFD